MDGELAWGPDEAGGRHAGLKMPAADAMQRCFEMVGFLRRLCNSEGTGARVSLRAGGSVVVSDVGAWPQSYTDAVQARYPRVAVSVAGSDTCGFVIVLTDTSVGEPRRRNALVLCAVAVVLFVTVVLCVHAFAEFTVIKPNEWVHADGPGAAAAGGDAGAREAPAAPPAAVPVPAGQGPAAGPSEDAAGSTGEDAAEASGLGASGLLLSMFPGSRRDLW